MKTINNDIHDLFIKFVACTESQRKTFDVVAEFVDCNVSKVKAYFDKKTISNVAEFEEEIVHCMIMSYNKIIITKENDESFCCLDLEKFIESFENYTMQMLSKELARIQAERSNETLDKQHDFFSDVSIVYLKD